ncbi:hypothetical protein AB0C02_12210 [Micromonospora sp. NPDC048999]|uniref:hypothetical protein n=1 Tax=Micromonospora sp. NPDC048999 TaxID=3155391 RepID=UPI00340B02CE
MDDLPRPEEPTFGGAPWLSNGLRNSNGVPLTGPDDQSGDQENSRQTFASRQDLEDAADVLFAHPPRQVTRWLCGCGADYPCPEVLFARLVRTATVQTTE